MRLILFKGLVKMILLYPMQGRGKQNCDLKQQLKLGNTGLLHGVTGPMSRTRETISGLGLLCWKLQVQEYDPNHTYFGTSNRGQNGNKFQGEERLGLG